MKNIRKIKRRFEDDNLEASRHIRKPMPKPSRAMDSKDLYNRRDKSWMKNIEEDEDEDLDEGRDLRETKE